ncbi:MAG: hypothetical protein Q7R81_06945 [Candidatus Peregrinibacteria bacterium]|nr:hypothetical protein [Candidatus Peregrinibacteria bacterium]
MGSPLHTTVRLCASVAVCASLLVVPSVLRAAPERSDTVALTLQSSHGFALSHGETEDTENTGDAPLPSSAAPSIVITMGMLTLWMFGKRYLL